MSVVYITFHSYLSPDAKMAFVAEYLLVGEYFILLLRQYVKWKITPDGSHCVRMASYVQMLPPCDASSVFN